jgi:hypothetical protein
MYGVPADLPLAMFEKATLVQVCLGEYQLQLRFQNDEHARKRSAGPTISIEGRWELCDDSEEYESFSIQPGDIFV